LGTILPCQRLIFLCAGAKIPGNFRLADTKKVRAVCGEIKVYLQGQSPFAPALR